MVDVDSQFIFNDQAPFTFNVEQALALRFKLSKRKQELLSQFPQGFTVSSNNIIDYLTNKYNWKPSYFTKNGNPSTKGNHLALLDYPEIDTIIELKEIDKITSYVNSWLKYQHDGKLTHSCISIGSATHRVAHSNPNIGAIPSHGKYGKACRRLFSTSEGTYQIGIDLSGVELRVLAHYLYKYDGGKYASVIESGDIHSYNADALGSTRDVAKVFVYAWLYGAGAETLREMMGYVSPQETTKMITQFGKNITGLTQLGLDVRNRAQELGYLKAIDGRKIIVDETYKSMNYLLQSTAAVIAKTWMVMANERLKEKFGNKFKQLAFVHDELQFQVDNSIDKDEFISIVTEAALDAGKKLGLRIPVRCEAKTGTCWAETH